jgi:hypothetical protein
MTRNLLDRLDAAIDGLCPCGADPRPDSAYCGPDCEPTHRSVDTTADHDGTQMRWRPDMVTAHNDTDLYDLGTMTWYTGTHNARLYQRGIPDRGQPITWHLRLDDGNRYVGLDMHLGTHVDVLADDHEQRMTEAWSRLERELNNRRHLERPPFPGPTASSLEQLQAHLDPQRAEQLASFSPTILRIGQALHQFNTALTPVVEWMRYFVDVVHEPQDEPQDESAAHPLDRVRAQRRNQPHGPQRQQRPPRNLSR